MINTKNYILLINDQNLFKRLNIIPPFKTFFYKGPEELKRFLINKDKNKEIVNNRPAYKKKFLKKLFFIFVESDKENYAHLYNKMIFKKFI